MEAHCRTVEDILAGAKAPIPLEVIPNQMGINLCAVHSIAWQEQDDGQIVSLTIYFIPEQPKPESERQ